MVSVRVLAGNSTLKQETEGSLIKGPSIKMQIGTGETSKRWRNILGCQQQGDFTIPKPERDKGREQLPKSGERSCTSRNPAPPKAVASRKTAKWQCLTRWGARASQVSLSPSTSSLLHQASTGQTHTGVRGQVGLLMQLLWVSLPDY